jgi:hypothetical protein
MAPGDASGMLSEKASALFRAFNYFLDWRGPFGVN